MFLEDDMENSNIPIALEAKNINKIFISEDSLQRQAQVLFDINLQIHFAQLTMIIGPSGCGKTTLISILSGILSSSNGEIWIMEKHLLNFMEDEKKTIFRRKNFGFIFQQYNLLPALTCAENAGIVLFSDDEKQLQYEEILEKSKQILVNLDMQDQLDKFPNQISGGQQQRVAIARALINDPKIVFCDEPTSALDAKTGESVMNILKNIAKNSNRAAIVVTHDNRIFKFADRIIEMSDGKIIGDYYGERLKQKISQISLL